MTAGCGCQFDAAGRVFVDHCVCPDTRPVRPEETADDLPNVPPW